MIRSGLFAALVLSVGVQAGTVEEICRKELDLRGVAAQAEIPGVTTALNLDGNVFYKGDLYPKLAATYHPTLRTTFFHSARGFAPKGSRLWVPTFHGIAADYSHAGSLLSLINLLTNESHAKIFGKIKANPNYVPVAAYGLDLPNCGTAFRDPNFLGVPDVLSWTRAAVDFPPSVEPELDMMTVPIARSASPGMVAPLKGRFQGMIWGSPTHIDDYEVGTEIIEQLAAEFGLDGKPKLVKNQIALDWINKLMKLPEMGWRPHQPPVDYPILILGGTNDREEIAANGRTVGWREYERWQREYPNRVRFIKITGAPHDVYNTQNPEVLLKVMGLTYRFFQFVLNRETDLAAAFPEDVL